MNGGILATFEVAYFCGWTVCEETKKLLRPSRPSLFRRRAQQASIAFLCLWRDMLFAFLCEEFVLLSFVSDPHISF